MSTELQIINDKDFLDWMNQVKHRIKHGQLKAAVHVNNELLQMYWDLGKDIKKIDIDAKWGSKIYKTLSMELRKEFSKMDGFSVTNLKYMKRFYEFYSPEYIIGQQVVDQFEKIFTIPWGHQILLITKCNSVQEALFYVDKTIENGWSRAILLNHLDTALYDRQGKSVTNFSKRLPNTQSELAKETLKDPYSFDFLTLSEGYRERELKDDVMAEYALESSSQPIGISEDRLNDLLPEGYTSSLPAIEEIEESLKNL